MKICFCIDTLRGGGAERVATILCNEFIKNYEVTLIMVGETKIQSFYNIDNNIKLVALFDKKNKRGNHLSRIIRLRKIIKASNFDVVISFLPQINIYCYLALKGLKVKHVVSFRTDPALITKNVLKRFLFFKAYRKASGCVFQTEKALSYFSEKKARKPTIIDNPIDKDIKYHYVCSRKHNIVYAGRISEIKNPILLIETFLRFHSSFSDYILKIYGEGSMLDQLIEKYESECIRFCGLSKTWALDNFDASMFLLTSNNEGMPNSLVEAMATGIPCISTNCPSGGPSHVIKNMENGILVPVNDADSLLKSMILVASNKGIAESLSLANEHLSERLSASRIANDWIKYIESIKQ